MGKSILWTLSVIALVGTATYAGNYPAYEPGESYGYSSEDVFDGGSYLGVDTRDITADRLAALQLKEERGVEVTTVDQDAPAGKAGLKAQDVILSINSMPVESVEQLRRMIREIPPGRTVSIGISRNGQPLTLKAELAKRKNYIAGPVYQKDFKFAIPAIPPIPPIPAMPDIDVPVSVVVVHSSSRSGVMVENLTPQLCEFFGVKGGQGILVRSVEKGSRAEKAGFRAGDVIIKVNGETINDTGDFAHALRARSKSTVSVGIVRDKKEQTLTLALPERKGAELFEESFEMPEIDAETRIDLSDMKAELAKLKPHMQLAAREMQRAGQEAHREWKRHQKEIEKEMQEFKREWREHRRQMLKELRSHSADI